MVRFQRFHHSGARLFFNRSLTPLEKRDSILVLFLESWSNSVSSSFSLSDKTIKLWKVSERDKKFCGFNLIEDDGTDRDPSSVSSVRVPQVQPMELMVEASPRRIFSNAHTYHINSISINSDGETYISADDLRVNLWHLSITDQSYSILFCFWWIIPWFSMFLLVYNLLCNCAVVSQVGHFA